MSAAASAEAQKTVVRRYYDEAWSAGNLDMVDALVAPEYRPGGPSGEKQLITGARAAFPDLRYTLDDVLAAERNTVVVRWTASGTHRGRFRGIEATGRTVTWSGITIYRLVEARLVAGWSKSDQLGLLQQLGKKIAAE
ncbi:MAG TPA: ester cyclase [Chloroflexota bacterium]|jgi:predicted ester cyclase|nr:ester cyclase [Chloroflexota bacterium]